MIESQKGAESTYDVDPFLESLHEAHPGDLEALLAAKATAKEVVAWAEDSEAAAGALLVFARYEHLIEVGVVEMVHAVAVGRASEVLGVHHDAVELVASPAASWLPDDERRLAGQRRHTCWSFARTADNDLLLLRWHVRNVLVVAEGAILLEARNQVLSFGRCLLVDWIERPLDNDLWYLLVHK